MAKIARPAPARFECIAHPLIRETQSQNRLFEFVNLQAERSSGGPLRIRDAASGEAVVMPFPLPAKPRQRALRQCVVADGAVAWVAADWTTGATAGGMPLSTFSASPIA